MRYGFIGLGHLGGHLAASLVKGGFAVTVHDLDRKAAERHLALGARWAEIDDEAGHLLALLRRQIGARLGRPVIRGAEGNRLRLAWIAQAELVGTGRFDK